ncbi:hypothetical protein HAZT_HAZT009717 [Hyalella azteca]|uniref:FHA domain-containing protein n=1 Tax=Hyalella azteca TaxID=294128 RepID=A0A6A0H4T6_HYAAZ|nr:hypothetical protein HAZT_HAZT009717 [Hyalella azteca]
MEGLKTDSIEGNENSDKHKFLLPTLPIKVKRISTRSAPIVTLPNADQEKCQEDVSTCTSLGEASLPESNVNTSHNLKTVPIPYKEPSWSSHPPDGYSFEVLKGGVVVDTIKLDKPFLVFGRLAQCDVMLEHPSISRFHCIVQYRGVTSEAAEAGIYVYDLSSTHGSYQNKYRLQPKVYNRLRVGHMLKFGGSSRNFVLMGPDEDAEEELPYTVAELQQMAKEKLEDKKKKEAEKKLEKEKKEQQRIKDEEERGIDWGMGPDAEEDDEDPDAPNPFSELVREELYLDDPKKSLRGWYEREGYELPEYDVTEVTAGRFKCSVKLPILSPSGEPLIATVEHRGKKKDTVVQAALEACRLLDKHGLFRQATHVVVDSDSDDEDEFLDRTGDVEKKRDRRYVRSSRREKTYTYSELLEQHTTAVTELHALAQQLLEVQRAKEATAGKDSDKDAEDLDVFMVSMNKLALDKHKMLTCKLKFIELRKEEARVRRLLNVARPASIAEVAAPSYPPELILPGTQRPGDKKPSTVSSKSLQAPSVALKGLSAGVHAAFMEEDDAPKLKLSKLDATEDFVPKYIPYDRSAYAPTARARALPARTPAKYIMFNDDAPKPRASGATESKSSKKLASSFDFNDPRAEEDWLPPQDQTGDGRIRLNDKLGY